MKCWCGLRDCRYQGVGRWVVRVDDVCGKLDAGALCCADASSGMGVGICASLRGAQSPRLSTGCQPAVNASVNALAMRCIFLAVGPSRAELLLLLLLPARNFGLHSVSQRNKKIKKRQTLASRFRIHSLHFIPRRFLPLPLSREFDRSAERPARKNDIQASRGVCLMAAPTWIRQFPFPGHIHHLSDGGDVSNPPIRHF